MKKNVYNADQLPSSMDYTYTEWSLDECNVRVNFLPNGKIKLTGEWLTWNEETQDWEGQPMTRNEVVEMMHSADLVAPSSKGVIHMKDKFQIKRAECRPPGR